MAESRGAMVETDTGEGGRELRRRATQAWKWGGVARSRSHCRTSDKGVMRWKRSNWFLYRKQLWRGAGRGQGERRKAR